MTIQIQQPFSSYFCNINYGEGCVKTNNMTEWCWECKGGWKQEHCEEISESLEMTKMETTWLTNFNGRYSVAFGLKLHQFIQNRTRTTIKSIGKVIKGAILLLISKLTTPTVLVQVFYLCSESSQNSFPIENLLFTICSRYPLLFR